MRTVFQGWMVGCGGAHTCILNTWESRPFFSCLKHPTYCWFVGGCNNFYLSKEIERVTTLMQREFPHCVFSFPPLSSDIALLSCLHPSSIRCLNSPYLWVFTAEWKAVHTCWIGGGKSWVEKVCAWGHLSSETPPHCYLAFWFILCITSSVFKVV